MKEYSIRYSNGSGKLITVCENGETAKYTESDALIKAAQLAIEHKAHAKIYKGRMLIHTITVTIPKE